MTRQELTRHAHLFGLPPSAVTQGAAAAAHRDREVLPLRRGSHLHDGDLRGLRALAEEARVRRRVMVSLEPAPRRLADGIDVLPWCLFVERLWAGELEV